MLLRGVPEHLRARVLAFATGHPLALSRAADVAAGDEPGTSAWTPTRDVVGVLLRQLVGELPSGRHRQALALCAHVEFTTEDLLQAVVPPRAGGRALRLAAEPAVRRGGPAGCASARRRPQRPRDEHALA
jgi:hypothetical protein